LKRCCSPLAKICGPFSNCRVYLTIMKAGADFCLIVLDPDALLTINSDWGHRFVRGVSGMQAARSPNLMFQRI
jgi:hypothetical protein